jgi:hypothetical protein
MKKCLWIFGDSFSDEFTPPDYDNIYDFRRIYVNYKGYVPKVFGQLISEELDLEYRNHAEQGECNDGIFQNICDVSDEIKDGDIIIINWSYPNRFRIASKNGYWLRIVPNYEPDSKLLGDVSMNTINEILINRSSYLFIKEVDSKIKFINNAFKNNLIINWTPTNHKYKLALFLNEYETISKETNGVINDGHYNENSHIKLAEYFIEIIRKNP